jgi:hypothetical protein
VSQLPFYVVWCACRDYRVSGAGQKGRRWAGVRSALTCMLWPRAAGKIHQPPKSRQLRRRGERALKCEGRV